MIQSSTQIDDMKNSLKIKNFIFLWLFRLKDIVVALAIVYILAYENQLLIPFSFFHYLYWLDASKHISYENFSHYCLKEKKWQKIWLTVRLFFWISTISKRSKMSWFNSKTCDRNCKFASLKRFSCSSFWIV